MDPVFYDEEGQLWPPATAALAFVKDYGGKPESVYNGCLVEINGTSSGFIETTIVEAPAEPYVGQLLQCYEHELVPVNDYSRQVLDAIIDHAPPVYDPEVYDLWALLNRLQINVHQDSVAAWTPEQRARVKAYAGALEAASAIAGQVGDLTLTLPPKPEVLP